MGESPAFDGSRADLAKRSRTNNVSMAPRGVYDREQRSSLGIGAGLLHRGTLSPRSGSDKRIYHSHMDSGRSNDGRYDKTGAPVNFVM